MPGKFVEFDPNEFKREATKSLPIHQKPADSLEPSSLIKPPSPSKRFTRGEFIGASITGLVTVALAVGIPVFKFGQQKPELTMDSEREAWKKVLGTTVEVKPFPASITPEVRNNLDTMGLKLMYLPTLSLGTLEELKTKGADSYVASLQARYPNWKYSESFYRQPNQGEQSRAPVKLYWEKVIDDKSNFPSLPGQWVAVEKMPKPASIGAYENTPIGARVGFKSRLNTTWNEVSQAIQREKQTILGDLGIRSGADIRLPEILEWNLMANRERWINTDTSEWTNTQYREGNISLRLFSGGSHAGGTAVVGYAREDYKSNSIGFRVAVFFNN